jgi:hypothetical protein
MRSKTWVRGIVITLLFGMWGWLPNQLNAQTVEVPQFKYDPFWPNLSRCRTGGYLDRWVACASTRGTTCSS